jgi:tRNA A37 threonylcarbamoyltransferase TsaD
MLRERLKQLATELAVPFFCPPLTYTTDNAAMIATAGYFVFNKSRSKKFPYESVTMDPNLSLTRLKKTGF